MLCPSSRVKTNSRENLLIVANSEHDADMLYASGLFVSDPFIYLRLRGKNYLVLADLEINRARRDAPHCRLIPLNRYEQKLKRSGIKRPHLSHVIRAIVHERQIKKLLVPANFPLGVAAALKRLKVQVKVRPGNFFPEREFKTTDEVKKISAALMMAEVGLAEGIQALKNARISRNGRLLYHSLPLTAEKLRSIIDVAVMQAGGLATHTIVAAGLQACDPHESGYGPLKAHQPIVLDVFPRSRKTGYFGNITRTVVKGRASEAVRKLYHNVARAQDLVFEQIRDGKPGREIHGAVERLFDEAGFKTGKLNGRFQGFYHGIGHGLGLETHESPRISSSSDEILRAGQVIAVEPGLYYPEIGGVRLEDVALVTKRAPRNLTKFEKVLEVY